MSNESVDVISTKLDILISDFQRFRDSQEDINKELLEHSKAEDKVQASIQTTQKWHTVIGSFIVGVLALHIINNGL